MKIRSLLTAGLLVTALLVGCGSSDDGNAVSVDSVGNITGLGNVGAADKFGGIVVSEEEIKVEKNSSLSVKEVKVKEGDTVKEGDVLFTYDTDSMNLTLEKQQLELEQLKTTITTKTAEKAQLEKDAKSATGTTKMEYTIQIQSDEADIKEAEYNQKLKEKEIEETKKSMEDVDVTSPITGTVKSVASLDDQSSSDGEDTGEDTDTSDSSDGSSSSSAFIVLTKSSSFEIKGSINELQSKALTEGMALLIRSRTDSTQTWTGVLDRIDWDKTESSSSSASTDDGSDDSMTSSTKYPFYVTLDDQEGLMLGQHVYIETNVGSSSEEGSAAFNLPSYYIVDADTDSPYVWVESKNKLKKRDVTLGDYNEETDEYGIVSGLELTDYIAYPSDDCKQGAATTHAASYTDETGSDTGDLTGDEEYTDDTYTDDDFTEDGSVLEEEYDESEEYTDDDFTEDDYAEDADDAETSVLQAESITEEDSE